MSKRSEISRIKSKGKVIYPIGTLQEVLAQLREFYESKEGYNPSWFGPIRSRSEVQA